MKKVITILLVIVLALSLSACQNKKPDNVSEGMYKLGISAIETCDDYLNEKIDGDTADEKIEKIYIESTVSEKDDYDYDCSVGTDILFLQFAMHDQITGGGTYDDIKEARNKLAKQINYK